VRVSGAAITRQHRAVVRGQLVIRSYCPIVIGVERPETVAERRIGNTLHRHHGVARVGERTDLRVN